MKETTRDQGAADSAADLAYVRLKSGEHPFPPYGEMLGLPGVATRLSPRRKIPANEGTTAGHQRAAEQAAAAPSPSNTPVTADNLVRLSDVRNRRQTPRD